jgi:hypothetical protein
LSRSVWQRLLAAAVAIVAASTAAALDSRAAFAETSVDTVSVALSTPAAGATEVTYTARFTATGTGGLADGDLVNLASAGAVFSGAGSGGETCDHYTVTDTHTGYSERVCDWNVTRTDEGTRVSVPMPFAVPTGRTVTVAAAGVTSPAATGAHTLTLSTTAGSHELGYTLTDAAAPGSPSVALSSTASGVTGVTYTVRVTTSASSGGLADGHGRIMLYGPAGTVFRGSGGEGENCSHYTVIDTATAKSETVCDWDVELSYSGNSAVLAVPMDIPAGHTVVVVARGVTNATTGAHHLELETTSDTVRTTVDYTLVDAVAPESPTLALTTAAAAAREVSYTVRATTSASGGLAQGHGRFVLSGPAGTMFRGSGGEGESCEHYTVTDITTAKIERVCDWDVELTQDGARAAILVPMDIPVGHTVVVTARGATNAATGPQQLQVSTTSDAVPSPVSYTLSDPAPTSAPTVALSSAAAGARQVSYTLRATTSASTGGLADGHGRIVLSAPAGTVFRGSGDEGANCGHYTVTDTATAKSETVCDWDVELTHEGSRAAILVPMDIPAGHTVVVTARGVTNAATGPQQLQVSTTSDSVPATVDYTLTEPGVLSGVNVDLSQTRAAAARVRYTVAFTTSATGRLVGDHGSVTLTGPAGTVLPSDAGKYCFVAEDNTCRPLYTGVTRVRANEVTVTVPDDVTADAAVRLEIAEVRNSSTGGAAAFAVTSSSDTRPATGVFTLAPYTGAFIRGTLAYSGGDVENARVQACPRTGLCVADVTGSEGQFELPVELGTYTVTALPPHTGHGSDANPVSATATTTSAAKVVTLPLTLAAPQGLPDDSSLSNGDTTKTGGVPVLDWSRPSTYRTTGVKNGTGVLLLTVKQEDGTVIRRIFSLVEKPRGSGRYEAEIPALAPLHGAASFQAVIRGPQPKRTVDRTAGPAAGGTLVIFVVNSPAPVLRVDFGGRPGTGLTRLTDTAYKVISPAGTGKVALSAVTTTGARIPLGYFTYLALNPVTPAAGPGTGKTTVRITGSNLGAKPTVLFGVNPSVSVVQVGPDTFDVSVPPGEGTVPVTVVTADGFTERTPYTYNSPIPAGLSSSDLLKAYYEGYDNAMTLSDIGMALAGDKGGLAGVGMKLVELGITDMTDQLNGPPDNNGYDFQAGPFDLIKVMSAELLMMGPYGWAAYLTISFAVSELNKQFFNGLIDPSGTIVDRRGAPVRGAVVTLLQATGPGGSFVPVISGPTIDPPVNPQVTTADGAFQWDAAAGTYRVRATSADCLDTETGDPSMIETGSFVLPPPVTGLVLVLPCDLGTATAPRVDTVRPSAVPEAGGTTVTVAGTGLGSTTKVTVGGAAAKFTVVSPKMLTVTVPVGRGTADVVVETAAGRSEVTAGTKLAYVAAGADTTAPTTTVTGVPAKLTTSTTATVRFTGTDPVDAPGTLRFRCSLDRAAPVGCTSPATFTKLPTGAHTLSIAAVDGAGNTCPVRTVAWTVDATAPVATATAPTSFGSLSTAMVARWTGTDVGSGVASYDVRYQRAPYNGPFSAVTYPKAWQATKSTSVTLTGAAGSAYCFSVRTRDTAGNSSPWSAARCTSVALDDRSLSASAGWKRVRASGDYAGTHTLSTRPGATLSRTGVQARRVAIVVTRCPSCGSIVVSLGSTRLGTVNLYAKTTQRKVVVWLPALPSVRSGTVTVRVTSRTGRAVRVDGLVVSRL